MKAYKCDICNSYFEDENASETGYSHMNSIYISHINSQGFLIADKNRMDCCPSCMIAIEELIKRRRNNHHDKV